MSEAYQHDDSTPGDVIPQGSAIVERFGGIRPMATKLNVPVTTVQGWKKRDAIPAIRRDEILNAAAAYDVDLQGLVAETANQNSYQSNVHHIAEDPALNQRPNQPQAPRRAEAPRNNDFNAIDLRQVRKTAQRTSLITTACLIAIVGGAGFLLFGGDVNIGSHVNSLETRMSAVERQTQNAPTTPAVIGQTVAALQTQVDNIATAIGASDDSLSQMARNVAAGTGVSLTQRLAVLEQQLAGGASGGVAAMVDRTEILNQSPSGRMELQSALEELRGIVTGLQGRTDEMQLALIKAQGDNDALGRTLADISARDVGAAAMLLTLTEVREAADRQTPFAQDLVMLRDLAKATDPELAASVEKLAPYAETGILSSSGLKRELQASANDIIAAKLSGQDVSIKEKIKARIQGLFTIKKDGVAVAGSTERQLIDAASAQLDRGDIVGARATLSKLDGPAAAAAAPWKKQADATLAAQDLDAQLVNAIVTKIKAAARPANAPINMSPQVPQMAPQIMPQAAPETQQNMLSVTPGVAQEATPTPAPTPQFSAPSNPSAEIIQQ